MFNRKLSDTQILLLKCFGKSNHVKPNDKKRYQLLKKLSKLSETRINHYYNNLDRPILSISKFTQERTQHGVFGAVKVNDICNINYKQYDYSNKINKSSPIQTLISYAIKNVSCMQGGFTRSRNSGDKLFGCLKYYEFLLPSIYFHSPEEIKNIFKKESSKLRKVMSLKDWAFVFREFYEMAIDYIKSVDPMGKTNFLQRFKYFYPSSESPPERIFLNKYEERTNSSASCHYDDTLFLSIIINVGEFDEDVNSKGTLFICSDASEMKLSIPMPLKVFEGVVIPTHTFHKVADDNNDMKGRSKTRISLNIFY